MNQPTYLRQKKRLEVTVKSALGVSYSMPFMFPLFCCNYRTRRLHGSKFHTNLRGSYIQFFFLTESELLLR